MYIPSGYFRKKALTALKTHWQPALLVALIVNLPTMLMEAFSAVTGNDFINRLQSVMVAASRDGNMSQGLLVNEVSTILASTSFWVIRGLEVLAMLVTPCLALGMYKWLSELLRGREMPVSTVFCRMRLFLKAIGLQLLIILKILLWMLPGIAVMVFMLWQVLRAGSAAGSREALTAAVLQGQSMTLPVMILMIVPAVLAALRYALAEYIMAERPETRILASIRRSKELMKDQKKNLFFLVTAFLLWYLLEMLIASLLSGVLSLVFQMFAGLVINVWMSCSVCAFWMHLEEASEKHEDPNAEPAPEELN